MTSAVLLRSATRITCLPSHGLSQSVTLHSSAPRYASSSSSSSNRRRNLRNDEITHKVVQLADPETGRLNPPAPLTDILASIDHKTHFVELVRDTPTPIVKVMDKKLVYARQKVKKVASKSEIERKEIQLTWGVASGDLVHKLKKARQELEKGNRVDIVYSPKKGQPFLSRSAMDARVQETLQLIQDVGKEWQPRDIHGSLIAIHLQGIPKQN